MKSLLALLFGSWDFMMMKTSLHLWSSILLLLASCARVSTARVEAEQKTFEPVQRVIEKGCVHCHGDNRLSSMPSIESSRALARLVGAGKWIVPGHPEMSRFYQVVVFGDEVPGAMPPTGHAISKKDAAVLKKWIMDGAKLPSGPEIYFSPLGQMPRSI
jgi:hypothetical protein